MPAVAGLALVILPAVCRRLASLCRQATCSDDNGGKGLLSKWGVKSYLQLKTWIVAASLAASGNL